MQTEELVTPALKHLEMNMWYGSIQLFSWALDFLPKKRKDLGRNARNLKEKSAKILQKILC